MKKIRELFRKNEIKLLFIVFLFTIIILIVTAIMHCYYNNELNKLEAEIKVVNCYIQFEEIGIANDNTNTGRIPETR